MSKDQARIRVLEPVPICAACFDFTVDGQKYQRRTIVVVPIVVEEKMSGVFQYGWACSRGSNCRDPNCRYSRSWKRREHEENSDAMSPIATIGDR